MSERGEIVAWQCQWGGSCPDSHDEFDPIPKEWDGPPDVITPLVRQSDYLALREELVELRQAVWDARAIMGFDNDGDSTPDALKFPTLAVMVIADAKEMRDDYDAAIAELDALKARIAASPVARVSLVTDGDASTIGTYLHGEGDLVHDLCGNRVRLLLEES